ncbi:hypothetical protein HUG17_8301 [Dermatophagoides farinae]|uniref:PEHE domain-containing protein n=1 Tax=Dermatophagoides farinae TaxID=6954 RepID=A0A9D4NYZ3_DERFA|nr:hypothetical protein HUG17_8301 [Dermatophagoides farinae]
MTCSSAIISFNFPIQNHELLNINTVDKIKDNTTTTTNTSTTSFLHHSQTKISPTNQSLTKLDQSNSCVTLVENIQIFKNDLTVTNKINKEASASDSSSIQTLSNLGTNMNNGLSNGHDHRLNLDFDPTTTTSTTTATNTSTTTTGLPVISSSSSTSLSTTAMGILSSPENSNFLLFPHARRDGSSDFKILENGDGSDEVDSTTSSQQDWTSTMNTLSVDQLSNDKNCPKLSNLTNSDNNESHTLPQITTTISLTSSTTTTTTTTNHKTIDSNALRTDQIPATSMESMTTTNNCLTMIKCNNNTNNENSLVQNSCDSKIQCTSSSSSALSSNQPTQQQSISCFPSAVLDGDIMSIDNDDHHHKSSNKCDVDGDHTIELLGTTLANSAPPSSPQSLLDDFDINSSSNHVMLPIIVQKKEEEIKALEQQQFEKQKSICNDLLSRQQNMQKITADMKHRIRRLQLQYTHKNLSKQMKQFIAENQRLNAVHCQRFELDFTNFMNLDYGIAGPTTMSGVLSLDSHHNHHHHQQQHQSPFMLSHPSQNELKIKSDHLPIQPSKSDLKQAGTAAAQQQMHFQPKESSSSSNLSPQTRSPRLISQNRDKLLTTIDSWRYNVRHLESKYDSDATESSSGGESCDESESFDDIVIDSKSIMANSTYSTTTILPSPLSSHTWPTIHQQQSAAIAKHRTSLRNRLSWKWCNERSQIASQWSWLQAHILDLETKLRQQTDLFRHIRTTKGTINFGDNEVVQRQLPSPSPSITIINHHTSHQQQPGPQNSHSHHHHHQQGLLSSVSGSNSSSSSSMNQIGLDSQKHEDMTKDLQQTNSEPEPEQCMRTMPFISMKRRKLIFAEPNLSLASTKKAVKYSSVQCSCNIYPSHVASCVICNGRYSYMHSIDTDLMPYHERVSLLDPSCHPNLCIPNDVPLGLHFANYLKREIFDINKTASTTRSKKKKTSTVSNEQRLEKSGKKIPSNTSLSKSKKQQTKINKSKKRRLSTDSVKRSHQRDRLSSGCSSRADSPVPSPSPSDASVGSVSTPTNTSYSSSMTQMNRRRRSEQHAFDINNIVIPYSIAATTRVERLQYKEIVTPKWRLIEEYAIPPPENVKLEKLNVQENENKNVNNGQAKNPIDEDVSDAAFQIRHLKCEQTERQRILNYYGKNQKNQSIRNKGPQRVRFESSSKSDSLDQTSQDSFNNNTTATTTHNNSKYKSKSSALNNNDYSDSSSSARKRQTSLSKNTSRDEVSPFDWWGEQQETVSPYEPRKFPLADWLYENMVEETNKQQKEMEEQHQRSSRSGRNSSIVGGGGGVGGTNTGTGTNSHHHHHHHSNDIVANEDDPEWKPSPKLS